MVENEQIQQMITQLISIATFLEASANTEEMVNTITDPEKLKTELLSACDIDRKAVRRIRQIITQMSAWTK